MVCISVFIIIKIFVLIVLLINILISGIDEYKVKRETIKEKLKKNLNIDSLNSTQLKLASDYYNDSEMSVKFKKVKVFFVLKIINV